MNLRSVLSCLACCCLLTLTGYAQDDVVTLEHEWLHQFVGKWESTTEVTMQPGQPPMVCKGMMNAEMLGEFWMIANYDGEMLGQQTRALQTIGFDRKKKKYIGTWVDNMQNHVWHYEGSVDASGTLHLEADGPSFDDPNKISRYRDSYRFKSKEEIEMSSSVKGMDGKWEKFLTSAIRRAK